MEQDEIKLLWQELSAKVEANTLATKKTLEYMLSGKRKTAWHKLKCADKVSSIITLFVAVLLGYVLFKDGTHFLFVKIQVIILLLFAGIMNFLAYRILAKLDFNGEMIVLCQRVSYYKKLYNWSYLISYLLVIIFIVSIAVCVTIPVTVQIVMLLLLPICIAVDCLIYHSVSNILKTLISATKELKDLKEI